MDLLTRDQILTAQDIVTERVDVPEWGGAVLVRGLTGTEREAFERTQLSKSDGTYQVNLQRYREYLIVQSCVDAAGQRLFTPQDVKALAAKSAAALQRVVDVAQRLSGLTASDVDELTKKSESRQNGDSGSDLPDTWAAQ